MGRPSTYTDEIAAAICERLSEGEDLVTICADPAMPARRTVYEWMDVHPDFRTNCARAREAQAEVMDHRILAVAGKIEREELNPKAGAVVLSALQWRAERLDRRRYGQKVALDVDASVAHYVVEVPAPQNREQWLAEHQPPAASSSGDPSPAHKSPC